MRSLYSRLIILVCLTKTCFGGIKFGSRKNRKGRRSCTLFRNTALATTSRLSADICLAGILPLLLFRRALVDATRVAKVKLVATKVHAQAGRSSAAQEDGDFHRRGSDGSRVPEIPRQQIGHTQGTCGIFPSEHTDRRACQRCGSSERFKQEQGETQERGAY